MGTGYVDKAEKKYSKESNNAHVASVDVVLFMILGGYVISAHRYTALPAWGLGTRSLAVVASVMDPENHAMWVSHSMEVSSAHVLAGAADDVHDGRGGLGRGCVLGITCRGSGEVLAVRCRSLAWAVAVAVVVAVTKKVQS